MRKTLLYTLLFCFAVQYISGMDLYFKHLSAAEGLTQPSAISIRQDKLGNIWFGNDILNKYDGNTVKTYRLSDYLHSIQDVNIKQILGNSNDSLYILANTRLVIYDLRADNFSNTGIEAEFIYLKDDLVYYGQYNCVYLFNPQNGKSEKVFELQGADNTVKTIAFYDDAMWVGATDGLYKVDGNNKTEHVIESENISCIFRDSKQNIWVGTINNGIRIIKADTGDILTLKENLPFSPECRLSNNNIRCINEDDKQSIWIGTYKGITLYSLETETTSIVLHNEYLLYSLMNNSIYTIYKDRQGTMWVGSYYGGVSYFNPGVELYRYYGTSRINDNMLGGFIIGNMTEDNDANLYIATEEGGINFFDRHNKDIKRFDKENGTLPHNTIKSIWYDKKYKRLYVGTFTEGLWIKDENSNLFRPLGNDKLLTLNQKIISRITPYDDNYVIVLTQNGIFKVNRRTLAFSLFSDTKELSYEDTGIIHYLFVDSEKTIWVSCVKKGLFNINLNTGKIKYFNREDFGSVKNDFTVSKILTGKNNQVYFLSRSGLVVYNKELHSFRIINADSGLLLAGLYMNMIVLPSGNLVISSDKGITLYKPDKNTSVHLPFAKIFPLKSINGSCGLYATSDNNEIFIGGINGMLTLFEKDLITMGGSDDNSYNLFFSALSVNNEEINPSSEQGILDENVSYSKLIKLNYRQSNISITFTSSDYMHMNAPLYEYILEGFDKQWTITRDKIIRYTSLPPGKYKLVVRELDDETKSKEIDIVITPPFYASVGAYVVYSLLAVALLMYIVYFMQKNALLRASLKMEHREKLHIEELNRMKVNFFTNISHEFRTPLTLISSQVDMLLKNFELSQSMKNRFLKIKKHTRELQQLINELMHFNKLEQGTFPVKVSHQDITDFLNDIYISFKDLAQTRNIAFFFDHTDEEIEVWFDSAQMQKVIYNLLSNAFKFTKEKGEVRMALRRKRDFVEITVRDTGIGIKESDLEKIFERFYQVNNNEFSVKWMEGMGIGLALSRNIVNQHSGELLVESKVDEMTCFTVRLLLGDAHFTDEQKDTWSTDESLYIANSQPEESEEAETPEEKVIYTEDASKADILIIEDNEELVRLLSEAFSPIYNVKVASDGETGLNMALEDKPDLVLSDIMIPRLSGLEVCKRIKSNVGTSHIPVILITARSSVKQNKEGLQYGADDYIIKPFDLELLLLKCNNLVKSRKELQLKYQAGSLVSIPDNGEMATNSADQKFLDDSLNVLEANLSNTGFDTNVWAREMNIGRSKLFNRVKEITGHTPNEFLVIFKMKKAEKLLKEETTITVAEVAYSLGFSSPGYFNKCFKEQFGVTPSQYRKGV